MIALACANRNKHPELRPLPDSSELKVRRPQQAKEIETARRKKNERYQ